MSWPAELLARRTNRNRPIMKPRGAAAAAKRARHQSCNAATNAIRSCDTVKKL